ncbi:MAG: TetR/AcrR family transcriptional regulator [Actinomycetota bacterium]
MARRRDALTRPRVIAAATAVADRDGLTALTMRSLASELGVAPMAVYHHVPNKEAILDGVVDAVFSEITLPDVGGDWRTEMRMRAASAREVLRRHPWAVGLLESRAAPGPATLTHHDTVIAAFRAAGFSVRQTAHAMAVIDSFVYGFAVQEASLPFDDSESLDEVADGILDAETAERFPHLTELATVYVLEPGYSFGDEFDLGLDLILDGLDRLPRAAG